MYVHTDQLTNPITVFAHIFKLRHGTQKFQDFFLFFFVVCFLVPFFLGERGCSLSSLKNYFLVALGKYITKE
jgi:hypothetical protein